MAIKQFDDALLSIFQTNFQRFNLKLTTNSRFLNRSRTKRARYYGNPLMNTEQQFNLTNNVEKNYKALKFFYSERSEKIFCFQFSFSNKH